MQEDLPTLYELCLERTARLLKNTYWDPELPLNQNPFASLPSSIIDRLLIYVERVSVDELLLSSDLRLLLTSGQVTELKLHHRDVYAVDFKKMMADLSTSCRLLTVVELFFVPWLDGNNSSIVRDSINGLLREARNLKHLQTCIPFDLRALCKSVQLEKLALYFKFENHIQDFLKVKGQLRHHPSFKHLEVFLTCNQDISRSDMAMLLKYCDELISVDWDIAEALEYLHSKELKKGSLSHTYKMRKCCLGIQGTVRKGATRDALLIASLTCPDLQDVHVGVTDDAFILALCGCQNLSRLMITGEPPLSSGKYNLGLRPLLEKPKIGHNLKSLTLYDFSNVDFFSIGMCCPNLEVLSVCNVNEAAGSEYSPTSFRKLHSLDLFDCHSDVCKRRTLVGILTNATNLKDLKLEPAAELTDDVLGNILKKNSLSNLKHIKFARCGLSLHGWRKLARGLTALEDVYLFSTGNSAEISSVVREINPKLKVT